MKNYLLPQLRKRASNKKAVKILKTDCKNKNRTSEGPECLLVPVPWSALTNIFMISRKRFFSTYQLLIKIHRIYNFVLNTFNITWFFFHLPTNVSVDTLFPSWSHQNCEWVISAITQGLGICHWSSWQKTHSSLAIPFMTRYHWNREQSWGLGCRYFICSNRAVLPITTRIFRATWDCAWLLLSATTAHWRTNFIWSVRSYRTF